MAKLLAKPKFWMGLSAVGVLVSTLMFSGQRLTNEYAGLINDVLGLSTTKVGQLEGDVVEGSAYKDANGSLSDAGWAKMIADSYKFCEEAVEQGAVLLKNEVKDGKPVLPLAEDERNVSLLGRGSKNLFMRSGAGGAAPNTNLVVPLDQAFERNGFNINRTIFDAYSTLTQSQMTTPSTNVEQAVSFYTNERKATFAEYSDAAIVTFVRIGTENTDPADGRLNLHNDERDLLRMIKEENVFKKTIVLINSPFPMSVDWVDDPDLGVDALIWMGVPGYYGTPGIVHVLMGKDAEGKTINPSGHLPDTFAASASSSPAYVNFGDRNIAVYQEGVYVGYKYYETRYEDAVLGQGNATGNKGVFHSNGGWNYADEMGYPFGFGLSYTTFEQKITNIKYNAQTDQIEVTAEVKNTGTVDGKASVQVYVQAPYTEFDKSNGLGKASIALMNYDKVDVKAGQTTTTTIKFDRYFLATYDHKVNKHYILEGGRYYFALGNGAHEALNNILHYKDASLQLVDHLGQSYAGNDNAVKYLDIAEDFDKYRMSIYNSEYEVTNQFDDADYNYFAINKIQYLDRQNWEGTWPTKITNNPAPSAAMNMAQYYVKPADGPKYSEGDGTVYNVPYINDAGEEELITFSDMADVPLEGTVEKGKFAGKDGAEIWDAFIKQMTLDDLIISVSDNRGILDVKKVLKKGNSVAEGPEGLLSRFQYGDKRWATGFPTGPVYTATFDHEMQSKFGGFYGEEALFCGVASVNAPGANLNRTPYGSRASEYMSEDGVMNYLTAANVVGAARRKGLIMNIKHCFLNNQENGRQRISTFADEQTIREIYLRPFEGALTKGKGLGIMTSYNRIGVRYAATHEPLMMNVMRGEWNYKGLIIDDALTGSNTDQYSNGPAMLYCGTDLFCLDGNRGNQLRQWVTQNDDGTILLALQRANKYVMYAISRSWMGGLRISEADLGNPWWKDVVNGMVIGTTVITAALIGLYVFSEIISKKKPVAGAKQEDMKMELIKNFLKNKSIAYFIVLANAVLALVVSIIFFLTYKGAMPNSAAGKAPESIGIFLLVGFVIELVALCFPQYRFIHAIAVGMFGIALYKEVIIIPVLIAGEINNVRYEGGDFGLSLFYLITLFVIVIAGIVALFIGLYKSEEEADKDMKIDLKNTNKVVALGSGAVLVIAAILTGSLVTNSLLKAAPTIVPEEEEVNPITDEIKAIAEAYEYDFNPDDVLIKEEAEWDFSNPLLNATSGVSTTNGNREGRHIVYYFEGAYAEGYQGDYSESYAYLWLWDDGIFAGKSRDTNIRGYWYNSSLARGVDPETGADIKDCLNMVSNVDRYDSIITQEASGFYERNAYIYLNMGWGTRSIIINGYKYYPEVALFIDSGSTGSTFKVGETFNRSSWTAKRVLKNLSYSAVFKASEVNWTDGQGIANGQKLTTAGQFEVTATWKGLTATKTITVTD